MKKIDVTSYRLSRYFFTPFNQAGPVLDLVIIHRNAFVSPQPIMSRLVNVRGTNIYVYYPL